MKILMSHITDAKNKKTGKHNSIQRAWAVEMTGEIDPDRAIDKLEGMNIHFLKWQEGFHLARHEEVYDTKKNRYKGKQMNTSKARNHTAGEFHPSEERLDEIAAGCRKDFMAK